MIAPASAADWLQGLIMTTLFGGMAVAFSQTLRLDEPTFDDADELILPRESVLVGAVESVDAVDT